VCWGYGVILISSAWIRCLVPPFWGGRRKIWRCLHLVRCCNQTVQRMKTGNSFFLLERDNCPTFWWKLHESPVTHFGGSMANSYTFQFRVSLSLYYRSPDGATAEQTHCCCGEWRNSSHLHCESKKQDTILLHVNLPDVNRFSKFVTKSYLNTPPHPKCVATLPHKISMFKKSRCFRSKWISKLLCKT